MKNQVPNLHIPDSSLPRIVIIGAGFGGLKLALSLSKKAFQVVLIDRNNFHQFQPLYYQVAMSGLEPSSISFPLRKAFQKRKNVFIRIAEVKSIRPDTKNVTTSLGDLSYDKLVIATGTTTNYYGNDQIASKVFGLKTTAEALLLRNNILKDYEEALLEGNYDKRQGLLDIVIVGGGPTGVELAGALAEMKANILPKDYPELDYSEMDIHLVQAAPDLLMGMRPKSKAAAEAFLTKLGVHIYKDERVVDFDGSYVYLQSGKKLQADKVIWAAGVIGEKLFGLPDSSITYGNRLKVDQSLQIQGMDDIYAIGDIAFASHQDGFEKGHPQVAQVALQMANYLSKSLVKPTHKPFAYKDRGSMATIGRNKAVADLPGLSITGFWAWVLWLFVHLFALIGVKNKIFVFLNWIYGYLTYDQSLRLIIKHKVDKDDDKTMNPNVDSV